MTDQALQVRNDFMPALTIVEAVNRHNALVEFVQKVMKRDHDFGIIPGTDKPTLLKPGAEKLCTLFGLRTEFVSVETTADWDKGFFYFHYRCNLTRNGEVVASGEGSCNSREKKYRWRYVPDFKATDEEKARAVRRETKTSKNGKPYTMLVLENAEPYDLVNTIQKMAQKRAMIAATLIGVNASEFFTQDLEDMNIIDGDFSEAPTETHATTPHTNGGGNGNKTVEAPPAPGQQSDLRVKWTNVFQTAKQVGVKLTGIGPDISDTDLQARITDAEEKIKAASEPVTA